jgi:hypothetical protein
LSEDHLAPVLMARVLLLSSEEYESAAYRSLVSRTRMRRVDIDGNFDPDGDPQEVPSTSTSKNQAL